MSIRLRSVCVGVAVAATMGANTYLADAAVIQGSFDGEIVSGMDPTGLFGVVGQNLAGRPYAVNFTYDTSKFTNFQSNANTTFAFHNGRNDPAVHISFEINGIVDTFDGNGFSGVQLNTGALLLYSHLPLTFLQPNGVATTQSGFTLGLPQEVTGPQGNRVGLDALNAVGGGGEGQLRLFSDVPNRDFNIEAQVIVRNYSISQAVPEPSTIALIVFALLSLFWFGRLRRHQAH